jgi:hypothetical protein
MAIDLALAGTVVSFVLPFLKSGVEKLSGSMAETVGKSAADYAANVAKTAWDRIKAAFDSDEDKAVLSQVEKRPEAAGNLLKALLEEKLTSDPRLAADLVRMMDAPGPHGAGSGVQIMSAGVAGVVDARYGNFSGAQGVEIVGVKYGQHPSTGTRGEHQSGSD